MTVGTAYRCAIDAVEQFCAAIQATGLTPPTVMEPGVFHRFPGAEKRNGNTAGWCKLFDDGLGGCLGNWSSGLSEHWEVDRDKPFTATERGAFNRHVDGDRRNMLEP
jgi:putative DNA primase/helicase